MPMIVMGANSPGAVYYILNEIVWLEGLLREKYGCRRIEFGDPDALEHLSLVRFIQGLTEEDVEGVIRHLPNSVSEEFAYGSESLSQLYEKRVRNLLLLEEIRAGIREQYEA